MSLLHKGEEEVNPMSEIMNYQTSQLLKYSSGEIEPDYCDMIELYHGTTLKHLNSILENGFLSRNVTGISNYEAEGVPSNENLVYLSNKWHLSYAVASNNKSLIERYGNDYVEETDLVKLWEESQDIPVVISVLVPKNCLVIDEDIVYNRKILSELDSGKLKIEDISIDRALEIGTVGCFYPIQNIDINSIYFIGSESVYNNIVGNWYSQEVSKFFNGFETSVSEYDIYSILDDDGVFEIEFNDIFEILPSDTNESKVKFKKVKKIEFDNDTGSIEVLFEEDSIII